MQSVAIQREYSPPSSSCCFKCSHRHDVYLAWVINILDIYSREMPDTAQVLGRVLLSEVVAKLVKSTPAGAVLLDSELSPFPLIPFPLRVALTTCEPPVRPVQKGGSTKRGNQYCLVFSACATLIQPIQSLFISYSFQQRLRAIAKSRK